MVGGRRDRWLCSQVIGTSIVVVIVVGTSMGHLSQRWQEHSTMETMKGVARRMRHIGEVVLLLITRTLIALFQTWLFILWIVVSIIHVQEVLRLIPLCVIVFSWIFIQVLLFSRHEKSTTWNIFIRQQGNNPRLRISNKHLSGEGLRPFSLFNFPEFCKLCYFYSTTRYHTPFLNVHLS